MASLCIRHCYSGHLQRQKALTTIGKELSITDEQKCFIHKSSYKLSVHTYSTTVRQSRAGDSPSTKSKSTMLNSTLSPVRRPTGSKAGALIAIVSKQWRGCSLTYIVRCM